MPKTIKIALSKSSVDDAIEELKRYKQGIIDKNELFVRRLYELGMQVIDERIAAAEGDSDKRHYTSVRIRQFQGHYEAILTVEGRDILFIEFGAGIHYNTPAGTSPHPEGKEYGYTIGSYGKGLGKNDSWFYNDETGAKRRSYGTKATMPVYTAWVEMKNQMIQIAKEVFRNGE